MSRVNNLRPSAIIRLPTRLFFLPLHLRTPLHHSFSRPLCILGGASSIRRWYLCVPRHACSCPCAMSMSKAFRRAPFISLTPVGHPLPLPRLPTLLCPWGRTLIACALSHKFALAFHQLRAPQSVCPTAVQSIYIYSTSSKGSLTSLRTCLNLLKCLSVAKPSWTCEWEGEEEGETSVSKLVWW